jgi:2-hydroxy-3-keto-5-methylthiopentenyl-1-phosphate phosphatase
MRGLKRRSLRDLAVRGRQQLKSTGSGGVSIARVKCRVLLDFDGTISKVDTTDLLLERFAAPAWRDIEEEWKAGRIGSRECMVRQIDLVRATPAEMDAFIATVEIDAAFRPFVHRFRGLGHTLMVLSDGLDRTIRTVLDRAGINLPYFANHLQWLGGDRWRLAFPHAKGTCATLAGNCKCSFAEGRPGVTKGGVTKAGESNIRDITIMVGDGRSDFCVAERADLVLAKGSLRKHCRAKELPHYGFETFDEAAALLARWLDARGAASAHEGARAGDEQ